MKKIKLNIKIEYRNCICEYYHCNCSKAWKDKNKLIVYYLDNANCIKLLDETTENIFNYSSMIKNMVDKYLSSRNKLLLAGGHSVINLKDRNFVSTETITSVKFGMSLLNEIKEFFEKTDFIIPLNDFFMEKDAGNDENQTNCYRKEVLDPYILPKVLKNIFIENSNTLNFDLFFCSEKNMADKFKRHIKNIKKNNSLTFKKYDNNWAYIFKEREVEIISNNKPNCVAGNAATFRNINYQIDHLKKKVNYDCHIAIYPLCSLENVINGYLIGNDFYKLDLPTMLIFFDKKCF